MGPIPPNHRNYCTVCGSKLASFENTSICSICRIKSLEEESRVIKENLASAIAIINSMQREVKSLSYKHMSC